MNCFLILTQSESKVRTTKRKPRDKKQRFDTSLDGFKRIGIELTQEQLNELSIINFIMKSDTTNDAPVYPVILILKLFGLLQTQSERDVGNSNTNNNINDNPNDYFEKTFGRIIDS